MKEADVSTFTTRLDGPPVEFEVAMDLVRRGLLYAAPILLAFGAIFWGWHGAESVAFALVLVLGNFALAAALLAWTAPISLSLMMFAALFGYVLRLAIIGAAVLAVHSMSWVELWPMGLTIVITHLGLLLWETRHVSASLAFPGLKPSTKGR